MRLTPEIVAALAAAPDRADLMKSDDKQPGLWLRVRDGKAGWYVQWRDDAGRQRRIRLGTYPALQLRAARDLAKAKLADITKGSDPHAEKRERREKARETFKLVADLYLADRKAALRTRSFDEVKRHLSKHSVPLHETGFANVTLSDVATLIDELKAKSGPVAAKAVRTSLSGLFAWGMRRGKVGANPVVLTEAPIAAKDIERNRVLSDGELATIWRALKSDEYGTIMKLLVLLGQRREEVGGLAWSELEGLIWDGKQLDVTASLEAGAAWRLPAERAKNGSEHLIPLSVQALDVLAHVQRREGRDLLFGRRDDASFSGWSRAKAALDSRIGEQLKKAGKPPMPPWIAHDFRRTLATRLDEELGVMPFVVEKILNHTLPSERARRSRVAPTYNRSTYAREKRQALDMWGAHVSALVTDTPSNVVPLRARTVAA